MLAPLLPPPAKTSRHRSWQMRELMNAIFFVLRGGVPCREIDLHNAMMTPHAVGSRPMKPA
jgi:hypothetical protein